MEEPDYLICLNYSSDKTPIKDSIIINCCECDRKVWLSKSGQGLIVEEHVKPICLDCAKVTMEGKIPEIEIPDEGTLNEVYEQLKRDGIIISKEEFKNKLIQIINSPDIGERLERINK